MEHFSGGGGFGWRNIHWGEWAQSDKVVEVDLVRISVEFEASKCGCSLLEVELAKEDLMLLLLGSDLDEMTCLLYEFLIEEVTCTMLVVEMDGNICMFLVLWMALLD